MNLRRRIPHVRSGEWSPVAAAAAAAAAGVADTDG